MYPSEHYEVSNQGAFECANGHFEVPQLVLEGAADFLICGFVAHCHTSCWVVELQVVDYFGFFIRNIAVKVKKLRVFRSGQPFYIRITFEILYI